MKFPVEWLSRIPFDSWFIPGIILLAVLGIGNLDAAMHSFQKQEKPAGFMGTVTGGILMIWITVQMILLGVYWLNIAFLLFGFAQMAGGIFILKTNKPTERGSLLTSPRM